MAKMRDSGRGVYNAVCDVCGWVYKSNELKKRWDGYMVCKYDWEPRNILDFYRTINDSTKLPFTRPENDANLYTSGAAINTLQGQGATWTPAAGFYLTTFPFTMEIMAYMRGGFTGQTQANFMRWIGGYLFRLNMPQRTPDFLYYQDSSGNRYRNTTATLPAMPLLTWVRYQWIQTNAASATISMHYVDGNGVYQTSSEAVVTSNLANAPGRTVAGFGDDQLVAGEGWLGMLDDFRLWNVVRPALTSTTWNQEVATTTSGLVSYWKFDNMSNNTVPASTTSDSVITTQTATLNGAQLVPHGMRAAS